MPQPYDEKHAPGLVEALHDHARAHGGIVREDEGRINSREATVLSYRGTGLVWAFLENILQHALKPRVRVLGQSISAYDAFGLLGMVAAATVATGLTLWRGGSILVILGLLALSLLLSVAHLVLTALITGKDSLVFLRYFLSIMTAGALLLRIIGQPVLPYLENLMLGIGAMQGFGRIGCFRVGCCYGKPAPFGIRYTLLHAKAGFPNPLVGVRLFPIQLLESLWIFMSASAGIVLALFSSIPGYGLASYVVLFATGRFFFETMRGDTERTHLGYFSEAQWTSAILVLSVIALEYAGILTFSTWHLVIGCLLITGIAYILVLEFKSGAYALKKPGSIYAVAKALALFKKARKENLTGEHAVHLKQMDSALQISDGVLDAGDGHWIHYVTLSYFQKKMPEKDAKVLAKMIQCWHPPEEKAKLINNNNKTFHLLRYQNSES